MNATLHSRTGEIDVTVTAMDGALVIGGIKYPLGELELTVKLPSGAYVITHPLRVKPTMEPAVEITPKAPMEPTIRTGTLYRADGLIDAQVEFEELPETHDRVAAVRIGRNEYPAHDIQTTELKYGGKSLSLPNGETLVLL